ncbi:MAG: N-acetyltransferase family protein [Thermoplasmata archaeon]
MTGSVESVARAAVSIRPAEESDAAAIAAIYNDAVAHTVATFDIEPRSIEAQLRWLRGHVDPYFALVAESSEGTAGWASLSPWSERPAYAGTAEVSVYVDAPWRGRRVGTRLLGELLERGQGAGLHSLLARVADGNPASLRLHEAVGFCTVGDMREVGWKFGRWVDVRLLQRILPENGRRFASGPRGRDPNTRAPPESPGNATAHGRSSPP